MGGDIDLRSGWGSESSSGSILLYTANAGKSGVSGAMWFATGTTSARSARGGNSGMLSLLSGDALESTAGFIDFRVGGGTSGAGGNATLRSGGGCQGDDGANGGAIYISSGKSMSTTSGDIYVTTCPANMVSGRILCRTGSSASSLSLIHI